MQEPPSISGARLLEAQAHNTQSPYPHCKLASVQRGASAATSVEAVQQGGEEEDVQGNLTFSSIHAAAGATSAPTTSATHQRRTHHNNRLPIASRPRQQSPASTRATSRPSIERGHSVVHDSEYQRATKSPMSQQHSGNHVAAHDRKRQRTDGDTAGPASQHHAADVLSPECSGASAGHPNAAQHETFQAAPEVTQQGTIQQVHMQIADVISARQAVGELFFTTFTAAANLCICM